MDTNSLERERFKQQQQEEEQEKERRAAAAAATVAKVEAEIAATAKVKAEQERLRREQEEQDAALERKRRQEREEAAAFAAKLRADAEAAMEEEIKDLNIGNKVLIASKAFNPIITKIDYLYNCLCRIKKSRVRTRAYHRGNIMTGCKQLFDHMAANKTGTAENNGFGHDKTPQKIRNSFILHNTLFNTASKFPPRPRPK